MEKILFMAINMNVGGMEKALLNMIDVMPRDKYDITILMLEEFGGFLDYIPNDVKVMYFKDYKKIKAEINNPPRKVAKQYLKQKKVFKSFNIFFLHIITKFLKDRSLYFKYILSKYKKINQEYDVAVAYAGPNDFISYYIINKVNAIKKFQWVHFDITQIGFNKKYSRKIYNKFDKIFVVSKEAKKKLDELIPQIKNKTEVFYNIISTNNICKLADSEKGFDDKYEGFRILTVGRLSKEKGQDLTIKTLYKLKKEGYNVRWYCIGDGMLRNTCEELISKYNLEDDYILLGTRKNPYPYMKECDIYVQPSRHEGYCITLAEAMCLNKSIVTTNFTGASEQIKSKEIGLVVDINESSIYEGVKELLDKNSGLKTCKYKFNKKIVDTNDQCLRI